MEGSADVDEAYLVSQADAVSHLEAHQQVKTAQLTEKVLEFIDEKSAVVNHKRYDVVEVNYGPSGSHVVLAEFNPNSIDSTGFREMAFVDPSPFTAWTRLEHVPELRDRKGLRTFYDMSRNDGAIRGALRVVKTPIQGAEWYVEPASEAAIDINIAKFVQKNLFEELDVIWERFVEDCLRSFDYGFFTFEKVYEWDYTVTPARIKLKRLAPIHPLDVQGWNYAPNGELIGLTLEPIYGTDLTEKIEIPIGKLLHIVFEMEGGDLRGSSILRTAFKHWYYKETLYKIDAIQKERHGIGVPIIILPLGFTPEDRLLANELGRNLRTNERAYITIPSTWEVSFAKLEGQPVDPLPSIEHHDKKIYEAILASFMGSRDLSQESLDTFYKSTRYVARCIASTINREVIKDLVDKNFLRKNGYPKLCVRRMGEWEETRTMTFALRNLVGAKILTPDEPMEDLIRKQMSLPPLDKDTARDASPGGAQGGLSSPQSSVKPPQPKVSRATPTPRVGTPAANSGTDKSGG